VVLAILALLALVVAAGLKSRQDLVVARARETVLREKIAATRERVGALDRRITRLRRDPVLLETLAREELGFVKPGDVVLLYPEPSAGEAAAGARPAGASPAGARIPAAAAAPAPPEP
jgi:cell division protein FtsB